MEEITLLEHQKERLIDFWNTTHPPPGLADLTKVAFEDKGVSLTEEQLKSKSKESRAVRKFMSTEAFARATKSSNSPPPMTKVVQKTLELADGHKKYIDDNLGKYSIQQFAEKIFRVKDPKYTSAECVAIKNYIATNSVPMAAQIKPEIFENDPTPEIQLESLPEGEFEKTYRPPKTLDQASSRVNKAIDGKLKPKCWETDSKVRENLKSLIQFCHSGRYLALIDKYTDDLKDLFEQSFVKYVWDKPDLTQEEIDLYLNLCCNSVDYISMREEMVFLQKMQKDCSDDSDGKRISMSIVESIANLRSEMGDCQKRQEKLVETLQGKRNERINTKIKENENFTILVDSWRQKTGREKFLKFAENREKEVKDEIERLETLDSYLIEIYGANTR